MFVASSIAVSSCALTGLSVLGVLNPGLLAGLRSAFRCLCEGRSATDFGLARHPGLVYGALSGL